MNQSFEKVLNYLAGAENIDNVTINDLQKLITESPWFPLSHFLLSKKLKGENEAAFAVQVQKTALYFSNPYWLHYQLSNERHEESSYTQNENLKNKGKSADEFVKTDAPVIDETNPVTTHLLSEDVPPAAQTEVIELEEEMAGATYTSEVSTQHFLEEAEDEVSTKNETRQDDEHDRMFQNIKAMLDASSDEADADTKNAAIHIDPYYTIDYFASQGIKLELEQNPQDQLGQNLKKFTHWLRHMKKLGPEDATEVISRTETDADIQQIADSSNTVREVVTEAMASVLVKQGKKDKAVELYNKLSFLNPGKSAYFADQIKKLKGT